MNLSNEDQSGRWLRYHQIGPTNPFEKFKREEIENSIPGRFEKQVSKHPARLAVKTKSQSLTYLQLNAAANRVAHSVLNCGRRAGERIALLFRQGAPLIAAALGVLKAGKAYFPLEESLPRAKRIQILQDVHATLILTDTDHLPLVCELAGNSANVLNVEDLKANFSNENPGMSVAPDQVAYIHYTSGSTGEPKGVVWNHRNELYGIMLKTNALHVSPDDRISLLRSNNLGATRDTWLALLNGASIFPLELNEEGLSNLSTWLSAERITIYTAVATVFRHSLKNLTQDDKFLSVRIVHVGGEPITKADVELYKRHFSDDCLFVNRYSISETQPVSYYFINKQTEIKQDRVPVGYPLEGNEILIVDENGRQVGANQIGEIAVRSWCLALGYWQRPEITGAKFLQDPEDSNTRIYLTGDLGYLLPDGCLVHVGRKDFQAKIRGHKADVSDVELALVQIPGVKEAAVVPVEGSQGGKQLIAYVVPHQSHTLTSRELNRLLKDKIPSYMLPSRFVILASLPLTASGKIDRRALPSPTMTRPLLETHYVEPRTPVETVLARIWAAAIGVDQVGISDDFSELGGDSLMAAQIIARVNGFFSLHLPLTTLAGTPTVGSLAEFVLAHEKGSGESEKIAQIILKVQNMSADDIRRGLEGQIRGNE